MWNVPSEGCNNCLDYMDVSFEHLILHLMIYSHAESSKLTSLINIHIYYKRALISYHKIENSFGQGRRGNYFYAHLYLNFPHAVVTVAALINPTLRCDPNLIWLYNYFIIQDFARCIGFSLCVFSIRNSVLMQEKNKNKNEKLTQKRI